MIALAILSAASLSAHWHCDLNNRVDGVAVGEESKMDLTFSHNGTKWKSVSMEAHARPIKLTEVSGSPGHRFSATWAYNVGTLALYSLQSSEIDPRHARLHYDQSLTDGHSAEGRGDCVLLSAASSQHRHLQ